MSNHYSKITSIEIQLWGIKRIGCAIMKNDAPYCNSTKHEIIMCLMNLGLYSSFCTHCHIMLGWDTIVLNLLTWSSSNWNKCSCWGLLCHNLLCAQSFLCYYHYYYHSSHFLLFPRRKKINHLSFYNSSMV